jgi:hypothetical protein
MKEMADAAICDQGITLRVVPVHIDLCENNNERLQLYKDLWKEKQFEDLPILITVAGGAESIPLLFPCLAHRFVLLEEEEEEQEAMQRYAS